MRVCVCERAPVLKGCGRCQELVLVENSRLCQQDFPSVQRFAAFDLGLTLLPVGGQVEAGQLLSQAVSQEHTHHPSTHTHTTQKLVSLPAFQVHMDGRENPFRRRTYHQLLDPLALGVLQQVPGVGRVKALALLQQFCSLQQLCNAVPVQLEPIVGQAAALHIHRFFHSPSAGGCRTEPVKPVRF